MKAAGMLFSGRWGRRLVPAVTLQKGVCVLQGFGRAVFFVGAARGEKEQAKFPCETQSVCCVNIPVTINASLQGQDGRKGVLGHEEGGKGEFACPPPA